MDYVDAASAMDELLITDGLPTAYVEQIVALHADYYPAHWGFTSFFIERVRAGAFEFSRRFDPRRDLVARFVTAGTITASLTIDGGAEANDLAHLRWFIVDEHVRGTGLGNRLMQTAVAFCRDHAYERIFLTTFAGLDPARHLYEKFGFRLTTSERGENWGTPVVEQRFERDLAGCAGRNA